MQVYPILSVFKKVVGAYFFQTQAKLSVVVTELSYVRRSEMLINCAGLKGLSSMIIISATFITIIFPQICDKHQTFFTPICFLYLTSLIAHQSYTLVFFY